MSACLPKVIKKYYSDKFSHKLILNLGLSSVYSGFATNFSSNTITRGLYNIVARVHLDYFKSQNTQNYNR